MMMCVVLARCVCGCVYVCGLCGYARAFGACRLVGVRVGVWCCWFVGGCPGLFVMLVWLVVVVRGGGSFWVAGVRRCECMHCCC